MRKENTFSMKEDLIDILAPPAYIHGSGNRAAKPQYKIKNLSSSGSFPLGLPDEYFDKQIKTSRK